MKKVINTGVNVSWRWDPNLWSR